MSAPTSPGNRKRSAHWTEADTALLVELLLRHKDTGRTSDNGFKPEVWKEAAGMLQRNVVLGGPKTADACKGRWQRLQRDFKALRDTEVLPGFRFDRTTWKLEASAETWASQTQTDQQRLQKIYLPTYDSVAVLCSGEYSNPGRGRVKSRTSSNFVSESSLLAMSTGSSSSASQVHTQSSDKIATQQIPAAMQQQDHARMSGGVPLMTHLTSEMQGQTMGGQLGMADLGQTGMADGMIQWSTGEEDTDGEYNATVYTLPDGSQQIFTMSNGSKRAYFDPSFMSTQSAAATTRPPPEHIVLPTAHPPSGHSLPPPSHSTQTATAAPAHTQPPTRPASEQSSPAKRARTSIASTRPPAGSAQDTPAHMGYPMVVPTNTSTSSSSSTTNAAGPTRSPEFTHSSSSTNLIDPALLSPATTTHLYASTPTNTAYKQHMPQPQQPQHPQHPHHIQAPYIPSMANSPTPVMIPAELAAAGLNDAQRRTQALVRLQKETHLSDEEVVHIMEEFERNVATADTYLAIEGSREGLRRLWLGGLLRRRKS